MRNIKTVLKYACPPYVLNGARVIRSGVNRCRQVAFDRRFGVHTSGIIRAGDLDVDEESRRCGNQYEATPRSLFLKMLRSVKIDHQRFTFIDVGSGKGAVLLYASEFPFRRIIGIEYSAILTKIADANLRAYPNTRMKCTEIKAVCSDALAYPLPNDPLLLYLCNPFKEELMNRLAANIRRSLEEHPREIIVVSFNPDVEVVLDRQGWLERIVTGWNHAIYRSTASLLPV